MIINFIVFITVCYILNVCSKHVLIEMKQHIECPICCSNKYYFVICKYCLKHRCILCFIKTRTTQCIYCKM